MLQSQPEDPVPGQDHNPDRDQTVEEPRADQITNAAVGSTFVEADVGGGPESDQVTVLTSRLSLHEQIEATHVPIVAQPASGTETVLVPGYRVWHEIARGGMGRILAARDLSLDRDVALKILLPGASTHRFVRESKITARLPHPGIPPVYALGTLADGSPFLAMKLIVGQTLAAELKKANQPQLLQVFTQVCQAVGFAHSRGVIHRDLKPSNIMVGAFGEVQVMDWGLARDLLRENQPETLSQSVAGESVGHSHPSPIIPTDESAYDQTRDGAVLGTPAYMAPEQARGETVDARADVFALGGILCAVLTGRPPIVGTSVLEMIQHAAAGDLSDANARLDACGADVELVMLCRYCLSVNPLDRPADGQALADAMTEYLSSVQERLQAASRERAVSVARETELRKRRRVQFALVAAVLAVLLGSASFAWWQHEQSRLSLERTSRNRQAVRELLSQCEVALRGGDMAKAEVALTEARKRYHEGGADADAYLLERLDADLKLLRDLDVIEQFRWTPMRHRNPQPAIVVQRYLAALPPFGNADSTSANVAAKWVSDSIVSQRIVVALDWLLMELSGSRSGQTDIALLERNNDQAKDSRKSMERLRAVLRLVDSDDYRNAVRDAVLSDHRDELKTLVDQPEALEQPPGFAAVLGEYEVIHTNRRQEILEKTISRHPEDLGLLMTRGRIAADLQNGSVTEQLRWFQAAAAAAPESPAAYINMGNALALDHQFASAMGCYRKAVELDPLFAGSHLSLGFALDDHGLVDEAIGSYQRVLHLERGNAEAHMAMASALQKTGQLNEAIAELEAAIEFAPTDPAPCFLLGELLNEQGQFTESLVAIRRGHALRSSHPNGTMASSELVRQAELRVAMDSKLSAFLSGEYRPTDGLELATLGEICVTKKLSNAATELYASAFAVAPELIEDTRSPHLLNAVRAVTMATAVQPGTVASMDDSERTRLRKQSIAWLRDDFNFRCTQLKSDLPADRAMAMKAFRNWQSNRDLKGIREPEDLAQMPPEEQMGFTQFWADVAAVSKVMGETQTTEKK